MKEKGVQIENIIRERRFTKFKIKPTRRSRFIFRKTQMIRSQEKVKNLRRCPISFRRTISHQKRRLTRSLIPLFQCLTKSFATGTIWMTLRFNFVIDQ